MVEAEYIAAGNCCTQLLWIKKLLHDYGIPQDTMCVFYDNASAINLSKNPVQHSKSKHIEIHYHFIRDLVEDKVVCLEFICKVEFIQPSNWLYSVPNLLVIQHLVTLY